MQERNTIYRGMAIRVRVREGEVEGGGIVGIDPHRAQAQVQVKSYI